MRRNPHNAIQDLDRELELLRRKRELLEVEQNILNRSDNQNHGISPWEEPPRNFAFSSFNDYTDLYDSAQPQRDSGPSFRGNNSGSFRGNNNNSRTFRGNNRKRSTTEQWDRPPAKRADRPAPRGGPPKFAGGSNDNRRPPPQDDRPPRTRPAPARSTPNKVTKPKDSRLPPQKLNTYPATQRKELVGKSLDTFKEVLRPDQEPSKQLTSRLELALGEILKDIRSKYSSTSKGLAVHINGKMVKQAIRDRIRTVMLGKPVDVFHTVVTEYRKVFPNDDDIVKLVTKFDTPRGGRHSRDGTGGKSRQISQADDAKTSAQPKSSLASETKTSDQTKPTSAVASDATEPKLSIRDEVNDYFKHNSRHLIKLQVEDILSSMDALYTHDDSQYKNEMTEIVKEIRGLQRQNDKKQKIDQEDANTDLQTSQNDAKKDALTSKEPTEVDKNAQDGGTTEEPPVIAEEKLNGEETSITDISGINQDVTIESVQSVEEKETEEGVSKTDYNAKTEEEIIQKLVYKYEGFMNRFIRKALPGLLYNHRNVLLKIISTDRSYLAIQKKIKDGNIVVDDQGKVIEKGTAQSAPKPRVSYKDIPYFVKILGRPKLPPREKMTTFLQQFNTLYIMKPRNKYNNILIIGLGTKTDFDNIVATNGTKIDNFEINVTPKESRKKDDVTTKPEEEDDGPLKLPDGDLDTVIDDLLHSIKTETVGHEEDEKAPVLTTSEEAQKTETGEDVITEESLIGDSTKMEVEENIPETNGDSKQEDGASDDVQITEDDSTPVDNVANKEISNPQGEDTAKDSKAEGDEWTDW